MTSRSRSASLSTGHRVSDAAAVIQAGFKCCGCWITGNAMSLLSAAFLFALITCVQYFYAIIANSLALQVDCISMAVDSLAFMGNLFAECMPNSNPNRKRTIQLTMSGISHFLLLGFTIYFIFGAVDTLKGADEDDVNGWIVFGFALGGLLFDAISLVIYFCFGERSKAAKSPDEEYGDADLDEVAKPPADALTCGINTNMCAALLHVLSDLGRSSTTMVESLIILNVPTIAGNVADGISALIICTIIVIGSSIACVVWLREVYVFCTTPPEEPEDPDYAALED